MLCLGRDAWAMNSWAPRLRCWCYSACAPPHRCVSHAFCAPRPCRRVGGTEVADASSSASIVSPSATRGPGVHDPQNPLIARRTQARQATQTTKRKSVDGESHARVCNAVVWLGVWLPSPPPPPTHPHTTPGHRTGGALCSAQSLCALSSAPSGSAKHVACRWTKLRPASATAVFPVIVGHRLGGYIGQCMRAEGAALRCQHSVVGQPPPPRIVARFPRSRFVPGLNASNRLCR